jgi:hypothetical protein
MTRKTKTMATNYDAAVNSFYLAYYGRPADPAGLAYWSQALAQNNGDFSAIINAFSTSPEATSRFGSATPSDRIADVYQQLFNRAPDAAGLAYWTKAIESGTVTIADAAIQIMNGAQSTDAQLSTLRQDAAAQFTAEVAASGTAYDGTAAIEAARVLIAAITPNTSATDITSLVTATKSLVQTAHDNPDVIKTLAGNGELSAVLTSSSGKADPVGAVQALANIGKAALTDSAGLTALLHGGGVANLLDSLPAGTSVKDVATAVSTGGLSAGAVVTNPVPVDTTPAITPTIAFVGTDGKDLPAGTTLVANSIYYFIDIHGRPDHSTLAFQWSATGTGNWKTVAEDVQLDDGTYFVRYVVTDADGNSGTSNTLKLVMDHTVAYPTVQLAQDTGTTDKDFITSKGDVLISGLHANEIWSYSFDGKTWTAGKTDDNGAGTIAAPGTDGAKTLQIHTLEKVDGKSQFTSTAFHYTLDTSAPAQGLKLASVEGAEVGSTHSSLAQADVVFSYTGKIDINNGDALFYRIGASDWIAADGTVIDTVNKTFTFKDIDLSRGDVPIVLETKDTAGNVLDLNVTVSGKVDKTAPVAPTVALFADTGASATDHITSNGSINVSGLEAGATWQYSTDNGAHWTAGGPIDPQGHSSLYNSLGGAQTVQVRSTDAAGNTSDTTTFNYTLEKAPLVTLNLVGQFLWDVTTNNKGLNFQLDLHGHANDVTTTYQISTTVNAADFQAWDSSKSLADGTYYFRAVGTDVAGNAFTTNNVTVHLDNTAPAAPTGVQLQEDTGVQGDGVTTNGVFIVSGLQKDVLWQFSSDGKTWYQGPSAGDDGTAIGFAQATGEQTLQVRTFDNAGNTSDPVSLHFTFDNHNPAEGLTLDHIGPDGAKGDFHTALPTPDVVFSYTGAIESGDTLEYTLDYTVDDKGNDTSTWTKIDSSMIDTTAKTITFHNFDLSTADAYLTIRGSDLAGAHPYYQQQLDGPVTSFFTQYSASAPQFILSGQQTADLYLTDGSNAPVKLPTLDANGGLVGDGTWISVGPQATAMRGVLGAGNDASLLTVHDKGIYALGTTGGDTLSGNYVWGFGGDDTITATGTATYNSAVISGGAGADTIHTESSSSQLMYQGSQDSFLAADDAVAHGFDTVYLSNDSSSAYTDTLRFAGLKFGDLYNPKVAANFSGNETGNALLAALNTAIGSSFKTGGDVQLALVNFGVDGNGHAVNFLAVDTDKDGHIGSADVVIEIVGSIGSSSFYTQNGDGFVYLQTQSVV